MKKIATISLSRTKVVSWHSVLGSLKIIGTEQELGLNFGWVHPEAALTARSWFALHRDWSAVQAGFSRSDW